MLTQSSPTQLFRPSFKDREEREKNPCNRMLAVSCPSRCKGSFGLRGLCVPATACANTVFSRITRARWQPAVLYLLFFFSGSAGLGYQMVWSKMFATGLGHEMPAVLAVLCAFMGGMALGAWWLDGFIARSRAPGCWYGILEILVGAWGFLSAALIPVANQAALPLIGLEPSPLRHWLIAFTLPALVLLPATAAMGATLPAMERFVSPLLAHGRCVGAIYASNTLGAVVGILASTFVIVPALGLRRSAWLLAAINVVCGAVALLAGARLSSTSPAAQEGKPRTDSSGPASEPGAAVEDRRLPKNFCAASPLRLGMTLFFTGLLGIGFETVGVRVLSQILENTVYTFAAVLSVFLLGTSLGAVLYQRFGVPLMLVREAPTGAHDARAVRQTAAHRLPGDLLGAISLACLLGALALGKSQTIYDACRSTLGDSEMAVLVAEMALASAVLLLPTIFMGMTFSCLVQTARRAEGGVGRAAALNTVGGALASALFGVVLLPLIGSKWTLVLISLGYLALAPRCAARRRGFWVGAL